MEPKRFEELGLSEPLLKAVEKAGYEEASPIQRKAIPVLLTGADLVGQSQTGTGKTAAFALPAIERTDPALKKPQVLVMCPTRELAVQVATEVAKLAEFKKGVRELPIYGGQAYDRQIRGLREGAQIIIGTPGRILDHLDHKTLRLDHIKTVILDEADRMLDMGFCDDIERILAAAPQERQTVFFSATLPPPIRRLIETFSKEPVSVRIEAKELTVPKIVQEYYEVDRRSKLEVLCRLIDVNNVSYGIIFCSTKVMVDDLTEALIARGYPADKIHGDIAQNQRERVIEKFRQKRIEFLVATDVAARGLDIDDVEVVFNYDLPHDGEDYVHRIGRTGRAGREGRAITFVAGREIYRMQNIVRFTKAQIRRARVPSVEEVERQRDNLFFNHIRDTLEAGAYRRYDDLVDRLLEQQYSPTDIASALIDYIKGGKGADGTSRKDPEKDTEADAPAPAPVEAPVPDWVALKKAESETAKAAPRAPKATEKSEPVDVGADIPAPTFATTEPTPAPAPASAPRHMKMVNLVLNVGRDHGADTASLTAFIRDTAKLTENEIGNIAVRTKRSYVDVAAARAKGAMAALEGKVFNKRTVHAEPGEKA